MPSLNSQIQSNILRYRRLLIKYENQIAREVRRTFGNYSDEIKTEIARILGSEAVNSQRVRKDLLRALRATHAGQSAEFTDYVDKLVSDLARAHNKLIFGVLEGGLLNEYVQFNRVTLSQLSVLLKRPLPAFSVPYEEELTSLLGRRYMGLNRLVNEAYINGWGYEKIVRRATGKYEAINRRYMETYARTLIQNVSGVIERAWLAENHHLLKGVYWVATLDKRTCAVCGGMDGHQWNSVDEAVKTPAHYKCRCFLAPVLKSWQDLGLPERKSNAGFRASMDGYVPKGTAYTEWFDGLSGADQKLILGPGRYRIYRENGLSFDQLINDDGFLTIRELGNIYGI
ncbi:MAG: phage minor head protein [Desulfobacterales bacterium]